jgi:hypothetical protein
MRLIRSFAFALLLAASGSAVARNTIVKIPLKEVLETAQAKGKLNGSLKFYLKGQTTPQVISSFSTAVTNPKTNAANKSDHEACVWAAISALAAFQNQAAELGQGINAVVDIVSYYKKIVAVSDTEIECHAGGIMAGVALKGTYAKVAN